MEEMDMGKHSYDDLDYSKEECKKIADQLEEYLDTVSTLVIINDKPKKKVKEARKVVKKAIKNLREGHPEKVFNYDNYMEYEALRDNM